MVEEPLFDEDFVRAHQDEKRAYAGEIRVEVFYTVHFKLSVWLPIAAGNAEHFSDRACTETIRELLTARHLYIEWEKLWIFYR